MFLLYLPRGVLVENLEICATRGGGKVYILYVLTQRGQLSIVETDGSTGRVTPSLCSRMGKTQHRRGTDVAGAQQGTACSTAAVVYSECNGTTGWTKIRGKNSDEKKYDVHSIGQMYGRYRRVGE